MQNFCTKADLVPAKAYHHPEVAAALDYEVKFYSTVTTLVGGGWFRR